MLIVCPGLLSDTPKYKKQIVDGLKKMGFGKVKVIGSFKTLPGEEGEGNRTDTLIEVPDSVVSKIAVHPMHLGGGFNWADDYVNNHMKLIPKDARKLFGKYIKDSRR